jgi:5-formyltetrahydrofolate cyclo-ligase
MRRRRRALSDLERAQAREAIARVVSASPAFVRSERIVLYAAIASELDPSGIGSAALAAGKQLLWPRVRADGGMEVAVARFAELTPDTAGVPAPPLGSGAVRVASDALLIVPGLAFTRRGERLGRGGGHYDRLLASCAQATSIGVAFDIQLVDELPSEDHDRRVQFVATPSGMWRAVP